MRAPRPLLLKGHVLVMEFIGSQGWPAPHSMTPLSSEEMEAAYVQTCVALRAMFSRCKLVHGDFSEYNLLWFNSEVVVIDVSQSVEWDHPRATEFLRKDCSNVRDFFSRKCERVLSVKALYDFVMRDGSADDDAGIRDALDVARSQDSVTDQEDRVFMDAFLPRSLQDLGSWPEAAQRAVVSGENENGFDEAVGDLLGANVCSDDDASAATRSESDEEDDGVHGRLPDPSDPRRASERQGGQTGRCSLAEGRKAGKTQDEAEEAPSRRRPRSGARRWRRRRRHLLVVVGGHHGQMTFRTARRWRKTRRCSRPHRHAVAAPLLTPSPVSPRGGASAASRAAAPPLERAAGTRHESNVKPR